MKNSLKTLSILLSFLIILNFSSIVAEGVSSQAENLKLSDSILSWEIVIDSISPGLADVSIKDIFDSNNYIFSKDKMTINLDGIHFGVGFKSKHKNYVDSAINHKILKLVFEKLLLNIERIRSNMDIFNYIERKNDEYRFFY